MFGIPLFRRARPAPKPQASYRPRFEILEDRWCPTPHLSLNATVLPGHQVQLSGTITGDSVAGFNVMLSGAASASATTDSNGNFSVTTDQASLGTVYAVGMNGMMESTDTAQATIAVAAPTVNLSISYGSQRTVTLYGTVTGMDVAGRTVNISGVASGSPVTDSTGYFTLTTTASALGNISANTMDLWGQTSANATVTATSSAPVIQNLIAVHGIGSTWTIQGTVVDESAGGLTVSFGGDLPSYNGQTTTTADNGTFSLTKTLAAGESGTVTAIVTDWWGQYSIEVWCDVPA